MRGAQEQVDAGLLAVRIIPADAGSTFLRIAKARTLGDHPRGCGEHSTGCSKPRLRQGSSPRMRGAQNNDRKLMAQVRIIPADAGSTSYRRLTTRSPWDHPRGCGEHPNQVAVNEMQQGSSPRMRGAPALKAGCRYVGRIIPADAGSTRAVYHPIAALGDHPRGCGEHGFLVVFIMSPLGSSPRMRGALPWVVDSLVLYGIIPADAGSTEQRCTDPDGHRDHPRGCGEHALLVKSLCVCGGSSPRMRGAHMGDSFSSFSEGIIPADAGSTRAFRPWHCCPRDHPRGCGEHDHGDRIAFRLPGSSPRMRGAR